MSCIRFFAAREYFGDTGTDAKFVEYAKDYNTGGIGKLYVAMEDSGCAHVVFEDEAVIYNLGNRRITIYPMWLGGAYGELYDGHFDSDGNYIVSTFIPTVTPLPEGFEEPGLGDPTPENEPEPEKVNVLQRILEYLSAVIRFILGLFRA